MNDISVEKISIDGCEYTHIHELQIWQKVGEHGRARVRFVNELSVVQYEYEHINEQSTLKIYSGDTILFCGMVSNVSVQYEADFGWLDVELVSVTKQLDYVQRNQSYQHTADFYSDVMEKAVSGKGSILFRAKQVKVPGLVIQYRESDWQFVKRMAFECDAAIFADITSEKADIYVGNNPYQSKDYIYAGNMVEGQYVTEVYSELKRGVLSTSYTTATKQEMFHHEKSVCPPVTYAGKVMNGIVKEVDSDKIKVHLTQIDSCYDETGDWYFPYSTAYSSPIGPSGFYVMPIIGDNVRVFFPSEKSEEAFAASSICNRGGMENKLEKCFQTPYGMGVYFLESGLRLVCGSEHVMIDLSKTDGIRFQASTNIHFISGDQITMEANAGALNIVSDKEINVGTDASFIRLNSDAGGKVDMFANKIFVV